MKTKKMAVWMLSIAVCLMMAGCDPVMMRDYPAYELVDSYLQESSYGTYLVCLVRLENRRIVKRQIIELAELFGKTNQKYGTIRTLFFGPGDYIAIGQEPTVAAAVYGPGGNVAGLGTDQRVGVGSLKMIEDWAGGPTDEEFAMFNKAAKMMREAEEGPTNEVMKKIIIELDTSAAELQMLIDRCLLYMTPTSVNVASPMPVPTPGF